MRRKHCIVPFQLSYFLYGFHHFCRIGSWKVSSTNGTFEDGVTAEDGIFYNQAAASNGMARGMQNAKGQITNLNLIAVMIQYIRYKCIALSFGNDRR